MVLVPVRCPSCGANVDLEEGQTVVRCDYCDTSSTLKQPARVKVIERVVVREPGPAWQKNPADYYATDSQRGGGKWESKFGCSVFVLVIGLPLAAAGVTEVIDRYNAYTAHRTFAHFEDGQRTHNIIVGAVQSKPRYVLVRIEGDDTLYLEIVMSDDEVVSRNLVGRDLGPVKKVQRDRIAERAFELSDGRLFHVPKIVKDARWRSGKVLTSLTLERDLAREAKLIWTVHMKGGEKFAYDRHGNRVLTPP